MRERGFSIDTTLKLEQEVPAGLQHRTAVFCRLAAEVQGKAVSPSLRLLAPRPPCRRLVVGRACCRTAVSAPTTHEPWPRLGHLLGR